jgi:hypothetical protein
MFLKSTWKKAGILLAALVCSASANSQCNCDFTIPLTQQSFNGASVQPGDIICLEAGVRTRNLRIFGLNGAPNNRITASSSTVPNISASPAQAAPISTA